MSKWYEVEVRTLIVYAIEVDDDKNELTAEEIAILSCDNYRGVTALALPIPPEHVATARKNADRVRCIDGWDGSESEGE